MIDLWVKKEIYEKRQKYEPVQKKSTKNGYETGQFSCSLKIDWFTWNKDPQSTFSAHILTENFWFPKTSDELETQGWWSSE